VKIRETEIESTIGLSLKVEWPFFR